MADIVSTDLPLPNTAVDDTSPKVAVLADGTTLPDLLRNAFRATNKWLFGLETVVIVTLTPAVEAEENSTQSDPLPLSYVRDSEGGICFRYLDKYIQEIQDDFGADSGEIIIEEIYRIVCRVLTPQFRDDSYPKKFYEGFSKFVLLREGIPLSPYCGRTTAHVWYGRKMPYFLDWMDKQFGDGTISRLTAALGAPYNKAVFETVTGTSISDLWKMYCVSQGEEISENEELNAELSELWPMPIVRHDFDRTCEQEWNVIFSNNLEPTGALNNALLAVFKHLYTPRTVPMSVIKEFCLVLRSGPMECPIDLEEEENGLQCRLVISWDWIESKTPTIKTMNALLVFYMACLYREIDSDGINPPKDDLWDALTMAAFVLIQEGIISPRIPGEQRRGNNGFSKLKNLERADFLCWIETTAGEGTVKKLYKRASQEGLDPLCLMDPTGKSLIELFHEFECIFPPREISEFPAWEESHIDAIYLDDSLEWQESDMDAIYLDELLA